MALNRRDFLKNLAAAGSFLGLTSLEQNAEAGFPFFGAEKKGPGDPRKADFHFVHLTDQHVYDKRHGCEGYRTCIQSIRALREKPRFVVMGGDMVFDGCYNTKEDYLRWLKQTKDISDELGIPWYPCMGNHDPFGMSNVRKCAADDPDIGKRLIQDMFNWPNSYYSFDHAGWHFSILDCIYPIQTEKGPSQIHKIGTEQLAWLAKDLGKAGDRPKIVVTHVAVFYVEPLSTGDREVKAIRPNMVIEDNVELRAILERHKVKACLQGHCHTAEEALYKGVYYITTVGAGGAWWSGDWLGDSPGYTVLHCKGDALSWEHKSYEWEPQLEDKDKLERINQSIYNTEQNEQQRLLEEDRKP